MSDIKQTGADIPINEFGVFSTSRGLVGNTVFSVLPDVKPIHTLVITVAWQSVRPFNRQDDKISTNGRFV
jgi:alpha-1,3-glucosyltransferase